MACNTGCLGALELPDSFEVDCELLIVDCAVESVYVYLCDHVLASLDQSDLDAAIAANKLRKMPLGNMVITSADGNPVKVGCREFPASATYTLTFTSPSMSAGTAMYTFWKTIYDLKLAISILWSECNGHWYLHQDWVAWQEGGAAGDAPVQPLGIELKSMSTPLKTRNEGEERCEWIVTFTFKFSGVLCATQLPGISL